MANTEITGKSRKQFKRLFLSLSNVSRSLFVSFFGLLINYILLNQKSDQVLNPYVYCISIVNLMMVINNWGGKDFAVKAIVRDPGKEQKLLNEIFNARAILFLIIITAFLLVPFSLDFKLFISMLLILKTFNIVFEAVITVHKKFHEFVFLDLILNLGFVALILFDNNKTDPRVFLIELLCVESIRLTFNIIFFRKSIRLHIDLKGGLRIIKESSTFFYMALFGFICSKADLYVVGLASSSSEMSRYFIILNLVSLSHVVFASFQGTYASTIFRYSKDSFKKFSRFSAVLGFLFSVAACLLIYLLCSVYYKIQIGYTFTGTILLNIFTFSLVLTEMYRHTRLGKQKAALYILILCGIINISVSYALIGSLGLLGAFIGNTTGAFCTFLFLKISSNSGWTSQLEPER
jgi:O-antigen/teichoic acid export membrane protein